MANEKKLDCVILGLLSHENLTGYEIKKWMDTTLHFFWSASYGSIYPTLREITANGFATKSETRESGRDKAIYSITQQGREHLLSWLAKPVDKDELRYETMLKLFFGAEAGAEITKLHIDIFEAKARGELSYLMKGIKNLESVLDREEAHLYYHLTAMFGVKVFNAYLDWCREAKKILEKRKVNKNA